MQDFPLKDFGPGSFERHVLDKAFNKPRTLDAAPTTTGNQLPLDGDSGWFSTSLYVNLGGTIRKIDFTNV